MISVILDTFLGSKYKTIIKNTIIEMDSKFGHNSLKE